MIRNARFFLPLDIGATHSSYSYFSPSGVLLDCAKLATNFQRLPWLIQKKIFLIIMNNSLR